MTSCYSNIAMAYAKNNQLKEAEKSFKKYEELNPSDEKQIYRNWARYYALKGSREQAILNLQNAAGKGYNNLDELSNDNSFDNIRNEKQFKKILKKMKKNKRLN